LVFKEEEISFKEKEKFIDKFGRKNYNKLVKEFPDEFPNFIASNDKVVEYKQLLNFIGKNKKYTTEFMFDFIIKNINKIYKVDLLLILKFISYFKNIEFSVTIEDLVVIRNIASHSNCDWNRLIHKSHLENLLIIVYELKDSGCLSKKFIKEINALLNKEKKDE